MLVVLVLVLLLVLLVLVVDVVICTEWWLAVACVVAVVSSRIDRGNGSGCCICSGSGCCRRRGRCPGRGGWRCLGCLVPCWGHIKNSSFLILAVLGFYYNKHVKLYPTRTQMSGAAKMAGELLVGPIFGNMCAVAAAIRPLARSGRRNLERNLWDSGAPARYTRMLLQCFCAEDCSSFS